MTYLKALVITGIVFTLNACTYKNGNFVLFDKQNNTATASPQHVSTVQKAIPDTSVSYQTSASAPQVVNVDLNKIKIRPQPVPPMVIKGDSIHQNPGLISAAATSSMIQRTQAIPDQAYQLQKPVSVLPLTWYFKPLQKVSIQGDSRDIQLDIQHNDQGVIILKDLNNDKAQLKSVVQKDTLVIKLASGYSDKITLSLPEETQQLTLLVKGNITSTDFPGSIRLLSIQRANKVNINGSALGLQQLYLNQNNNVTINNVATPYLTAWVHNSGPVNVHGQMNLRELDSINNQGNISFYLINSPILSLYTENSPQYKNSIFLSGSAGTFNFNLDGTTKLDARYVRAQKGFIKTTENSQASVTVMDSLNTFASGHSNIYYYHQPKLIGRYFKDEGSVLYMGETPPPCNGPYCPVLPEVLPG